MVRVPGFQLLLTDRLSENIRHLLALDLYVQDAN